MLKILDKFETRKIQWQRPSYLCFCFASLVLLSACSSTPRTPAPIRNINIDNNQVQSSDTNSSQGTAKNWGYSANSQQYADNSTARRAQPSGTVPVTQSATVKSTTPLSSYQVKSGDTLYHIATTHGISYQELAQINKIAPPYQLLVGETLQVPNNSHATPSTLPSHASSGERDYNHIPKGEYTGAKYTVKQGDTLYYIAWISNTSYQELAALNQIASPYALRVGEVLKLPKSNVSTPAPASVTASKNTVPSSSNVAVTKQPKPSQAKPSVTPAATSSVAVSTRPSSSARVNSSTQSISQSKQTDGILWQWPTQGSIIQTFSNSSSDSKGIDISGKKGQAIYAAATGKVVYAGDALKGYGNLIIIKHNDDYLTAYAHNDRMLVKEGQDVQRGQQIATMGSTGINKVELHFEIRYKGKAVDPQGYLP